MNRYEELVDKNSGMIYRIALSYTNSRHDAEDVLQEVYMRLFKKQPLFKSDEHEKAWFIRVTINRCNTLLSSAYRRHTISIEDEDTLSIVSSLPYEDNNELTDTIDLFEAISKLSPKQQLCIHLFYYCDMSVTQISVSTGIKETTVRSLLFRARNELGIILKGGEDNVG